MIIKMTAASPIAHGAFSDGIGTGNIAEFRRIPIARNGKVYNIPTVSGNAVRGITRRNLTREFFAANNLEEVLDKKEHDKLYAIMGNGGALGNNLEANVDVNYIRELRTKLPILSLLGGACYKYMMTGMCDIGFFKLMCRELDNGELTASEMVSEIGETRHVDREQADTEEAGIKPMPYVTEVVCEGAIFEGTIDTKPMATSIEISCLHHGIKLLSKVGGKIGRGYGQITLATDEQLDDSLYMENISNADIEFIKAFVKSIS